MFTNIKFTKIISKSLLPLMALGLWTTQTSKASTTSPTKVSAELVLSVDISGSVNSSEYNLQMEGYADAFRDDNVISTIESLPYGLAVNVQFWASKPSPDIGWTVIKTRAEAEAFANQVENLPRPSRYSDSIWGGDVGYYTNITGAITAAKDLILNNNYDGDGLVIDVSGDGRSNSYQYTGSGSSSNYSRCSGRTCQPLKDARDAAVSNGIIVNGLPIDTSSGKYIKRQYETHVIGGDNSFVQLSNGFSDFTTAATQKINLEIYHAANVPTANEDISHCEIATNGSITLDIVTNDFDPNGDTLTLISLTTPSGGTVANNNDNTVTYTAPDAPGSYNFNYTIEDTPGNIATGTVTVNICPID